MDGHISKQAVMNAFAEYVRRSNNSDFAPTPTWNDAVEIVENMPSADVQPVVRCKDCKWFEKNVCNKFSNNYEPLVYVSPYDFCSRGEQKDG